MACVERLNTQWPPPLTMLLPASAPSKDGKQPTPSKPAAPPNPPLLVQEVAHILDHACGSSLVIMDELGRATSTGDGVALGWAVCEALLAARAPCLFATHFVQLADLAALYPTAKLWHLQARGTCTCCGRCAFADECVCVRMRVRWGACAPTGPAQGMTDPTYHRYPYSQQPRAQSSTVPHWLLSCHILAPGQTGLQRTPAGQRQPVA